MNILLHHLPALPARLQLWNSWRGTALIFGLILLIMFCVGFLTPDSLRGWGPIFLGLSWLPLVLLIKGWWTKQVNQMIDASGEAAVMELGDGGLVLRFPNGEEETLVWQEVFRMDVYQDLALMERGFFKYLRSYSRRGLRLRLTLASGSRNWLLRFSGKQEQQAWLGELKRFTKQKAMLHQLIQVWKAENQA